MVSSDSYYFVFDLFLFIPKWHQFTNPPIPIPFCASLASHVIIVCKLTTVPKPVQILQALSHQNKSSLHWIWVQKTNYNPSFSTSYLLSIWKQREGQLGLSFPLAKNSARQLFCHTIETQIFSDRTLKTSNRNALPCAWVENCTHRSSPCLAFYGISHPFVIYPLKHSSCSIRVPTFCCLHLHGGLFQVQEL